MNDISRLTPKQVQEAEVVFCSHSGGKDSQAMLALMIRMGLKDKIVLVHSDLADMEWEEMKPWIESISNGIPCNVVQSEMDFFEMVRKYQRLPSGNMQFCTDFLKITPIEAFIHDYMYKNELTHAINATGMRASESKRRAKKAEGFFSHAIPLLKSGMQKPVKHKAHKILDWMPIFFYSDDEVFQEIKLAGQVPHKIYSQGFSRLSCVFCVNGRIGEHKLASTMRPKLARKMANLEREIGKTIRLKQRNKIKYPRYLDEYLDLEKEG